MDRRGFFKALASGAAGVAVADPILELVERALWVPKVQLVVPSVLHESWGEILNMMSLKDMKETSVSVRVFAGTDWWGQMSDGHHHNIVFDADGRIISDRIIDVPEG